MCSFLSYLYTLLGQILLYKFDYRHIRLKQVLDIHYVVWLTRGAFGILTWIPMDMGLDLK